MSNTDLYDEMKRKIRKLKKLELKIRFGEDSPACRPGRTVIVWEELFGRQAAEPEGAKYSIDRLVSMSKDEYREVLNEFFFRVYEQFYKENGMRNIVLYKPDKLAQLGLPYEADGNAVKARFRELAKKYHPDHGGDSEKFVWLMEIYKELTNS